MPAADIPDSVQAADHIEEVVLPVESLGRDYLVTVPTTPLGKKIHTVRIQPVVDGTQLSFDPPSIHDSMQVDAWQVVELHDVDQDFRVTGTQPFGVTQFMHGEGSGPQQKGAAGAGDPSQGLAVPTAQYRSSYIFLAPADYDSNYVNVAAPEGAKVVLDGQAIDESEFSAVGKSRMHVARQALAPTGVHQISADQPFGIVVYGYGLYTSYMLPGGLDVKALGNVPPPR
jgi:hypothetical protein